MLDTLLIVDFIDIRFLYIKKLNSILDTESKKYSYILYAVIDI